MPILDGQGQSEKWTPIKQDILRSILRQHIATVQGIWRKYHMSDRVYLYIDAYAGCGYNDSVRCPGSPVVFIEEGMGISHQAYFIDRNQESIDRLQRLVPDTENYHVICGDNVQVVPDIIDQMMNQEYGLLYLDPNGSPNISLLLGISGLQNLRYVDILLHYSGSAVKRGEPRRANPKTLLDFLSASGKKYWAVRELGDSDSWQRTFILGMNWRGLNLMEGFHYTDSARGKHIIRRLNYTKSELAKKGIQWNTYHQETLF